MNTRRYEVLLLSIPEITKDEASSLEAQVERAVGKVKGSIISFERWGKYKLSYPVNKNDYGVYFLIRFEAAEDKTNELLAECDSMFKVKFNDIVMRFCVTRLCNDASLEYERPSSVEEAPKRSFFDRKGLSGSGRHESMNRDEDDDHRVSETDESEIEGA